MLPGQGLIIVQAPHFQFLFSRSCVPSCIGGAYNGGGYLHSLFRALLCWLTLYPLLTKQALCVEPQLPTLALLTGQLLLAEILSTKVAIIGPAAFSNN